MAEAEEVITDVARHATIYARALWQRHRKNPPADDGGSLRDVAQRLDLLITAVFGKSYPIRVSQPPSPPTFLVKVFKRGQGPWVKNAIPATDGVDIWLPANLSETGQLFAPDWYRVTALQQAMRAHRQSAGFLKDLSGDLQKAIYLVMEAQASDSALLRLLPGIGDSLRRFRAATLLARPPLSAFPEHRRSLETLVRSVVCAPEASWHAGHPDESVALARKLAATLPGQPPGALRQGSWLYKDLWTGDLLLPTQRVASISGNGDADSGQPGADAPRAARLARRPEVREAQEDEDDRKQGTWMVQTSQPHEQAEDPMGMQRPTDRDESTAAEDFADSLSELPEARLVSTPGRPKEVLLSDDAPSSRAKRELAIPGHSETILAYPEWDYRSGTYREPGATVHLLLAGDGPQEWVDKTLSAHRTMLDLVRRRFEMLRAQRTRLRKQLEGDDIDLEAYIDGYADFRAGLPMTQAVYQTYRPAKRDMSIVLLIDISGSTDGWVSADKRVIDVEREALLLVAIALEGMREPYCIQAFSGEGPGGVVVRSVKSFGESYGPDVARRIASLEPEHYTRAGAAIRHASGSLMGQASRHRLLLLLSDGKPNDVDDYEGRYGMEDMRQAVNEAKLQGIHPFCLTIDRQAAAYLPAIFGAHQYALLPKPALLPSVLLEWMKRLLAA